MDAVFIQTLIENLGVPAAAIFAAIGYWYKSQREHKKSTRKVLYLMLELRHAIMAGVFDPEKATDEYFRHSVANSKKKGLDLDPAQITDDLRAMVTEHFENIRAAQQVDFGKILPALDQALLEMACQNPVLAYRLRGKEKLEKLISHTRDYQTKFASNMEKELGKTLIGSVMLETMAEMSNDAFRDICQKLDNDVLLLARDGGVVDYWKCKRALVSGLNYDNQYDFQELDKFMEKLIGNIEKAHKEIAISQTTAVSS